MKSLYKILILGFVIIIISCNMQMENTSFLDINEESVPEAPSGNIHSGRIIVKTQKDFNRSVFDKLGFTVKTFKDFSFSPDVRYWYVYKNSDKALDELNNLSEVVYADWDYINNILPYTKKNLPLYSARALTDGNLDNDIRSKYAGYSLSITKALDSYKIHNYGNKKTVAAIIDTGINMAHEDFYAGGKSIVRYAKSAFTHDTSGGGYQFFYIGDGNPFVKIPEGENWDDYIHGSHCSGIIAAVGDNGKGICGVAYKNTELISYKAIADAYDSGVDWALYGAIGDLTEYVIEERKAGRLEQKTIPLNISLGSNEGGAYALEMINAAFKEGILTVAASANNGRYMPSYPGAFPSVFTLSSTNAHDKCSFFNNTGMWINASAPGENIISCSSRSPDDYILLSGSSMAAPFATGAMAYLLSFNSELTPVQLMEILEVTADKIDKAGAAYNEEGFSEKYGYGRINVLNAATLVKNGSVKIAGRTIRLSNMGGKYSANPVCVTIKNIQSTDGDCRVNLYDGETCLFSVKVPKGYVEFYGLKNNHVYSVRTQSDRRTIEKKFTVSKTKQTVELNLKN